MIASGRLPAANLRPAPVTAGTGINSLGSMHWTKVDRQYTALRREVRSRKDWRHGPNRVHEVAKEGFDAVKAHAPFVGQRFCDLGCGVFHPFGISTVMYLNGAATTIGLDLHHSDPRRAAEALADLLMECLAFPERWHWSEVSRNEFIDRIRQFNLAALMEGDLRQGVGTLPLRHCVTDIHSPALAEGSIDIMTSRAVLEHFLDFGRAVERFYALLSPGGIASHVIDLVDHRAYEGPGHHYWSFLAEGDEWSDGLVNRLRSCEIRPHFERVGFEVLHYENVCGTMPAGFLRQVKGRFAAMSAEELSVTGVRCVLRKPVQQTASLVAPMNTTAAPEAPATLVVPPSPQNSAEPWQVPAAVPAGLPAAPTEADLNRVISEKTAYWQQEGPAINHLKNSGTRPKGVFIPFFQRMLSMIPPGSRVIDVGCGHGRLAIPLAEAGHTVVATDVSQKMLDLLAEHKGSLPIDIRLGDAHRLAAADEEFDVVISNDFLTHFPDWPRLLKEKARVCREGGRVIFPFNFTEHRTFAAPFGGNDFEHPYSADVTSGKPFCAACSLEEMIEVGRGLGLRMVQVVPTKFLHDSFALGGALGATDYREFQLELGRRLEANTAVADFFTWLEVNALQRLPFFAAYCNLVVFERAAAGAGDDTSDVATTAVQLAGAGPLIPSVFSARVEKFLNEIPSETSLAERKYLFNLFANQWDGQGTIVEVGPFLGGTTRAIAAGMAANTRRSLRAALHTFDRFDDYYSAERLRTTIEPMVRGGSFTAGQADDLCRGADFERLFAAIHSPHDYGRLVHLHNSPLPDLPDDVAGSASLDSLVAKGELGALFIDGCKSWASTHYAMKFLLPRLRVGAPVIFQDYGWYTCFWVSSAAYALREFLTPESNVDSTYTFRLTRPITANDVVKRLSLTPVEMGETFFAKASAALLERSRRELDLRAELIAQLHHVAALMTIGNLGRASDILKALDVRRYAAFADMIQGCLKSPTYLPGGKKLFWKEAA
jgi:SAM-dependent methyltransferase